MEAEVGTIGGEEDGALAMVNLHLLRRPSMVETGIDFLAAGIGNIHGPYPKNWKGLQLDHLQTSPLLSTKPLVIKYPLYYMVFRYPDDQIQIAILMGLKVNVNTEAQLAFHQALRDFILADHDQKAKLRPT